MKCSNCCQPILSCRDCVFCGKKYCCFKCLEDHYLHEHKNKNKDLSKSKSKKDCKITKKIKENEINRISPYLVRGIYNKKIIYDLKYELDNFTPVMDGKDIKSIGSGSFGQVYLAINNLDKKMYAIKHMDKEKLIEILHTLQGIYEEIYIQSRLDHPNIVKILFTDEDEDSFDLVMEYAESGSLFHYIRKNKGLNEYKTFQLFIQVVNAVNFLHENDLIHRDIKPENILLFKNNDKSNGNIADYNVKLCDFGWCVKLNGEERDTFCGTTEYMSPELVNHKVYSKEIDVWSLGILLYEMLHGYSPFRPNKPKFDENDVFNNIKKHKLTFGKKVSKECKELIENLLAFNKNKRYKVEDIYNSKFVKKFEKIKYCIPKKLNENANIQNNDEEEKIVEIHQIKTNNNNFINREINEEENKEDLKIQKTPIFQVYNELHQLNNANIRKVLTNNIMDQKIIETTPKSIDKENKFAGIRNKYKLSFINSKEQKNNSISFNNVNNVNILNKKITPKKSDKELTVLSKIKRCCSLQDLKELNHKNSNSINKKNVKKNRTISRQKEDNQKFLNKKKSLKNDKDDKKEKKENHSPARNKQDKNKQNTVNSIVIVNKEKNNKVNQIVIKKNENSSKNKSTNKDDNNKDKKEKIIHKNNNLHSIEMTTKIPLNKKYNEINNSNHRLKYSSSNKDLTQNYKVNTNNSSDNNSVSIRTNKQNQKSLNERKKNDICLKDETLNKNNYNKTSINDNSDVNSQKDNINNSGISFNKNSKSRYEAKKVNISRQQDLYKKSSSNFYNSSNNENINLNTIKSGFLSENAVNQDSCSKLEKTKNNYRKSPEMKNNQNSRVPFSNIFNSKIDINIRCQSPLDRKNKDNKINNLKTKNISNKGIKVINNRKISSISPKRINNRQPCCSQPKRNISVKNNDHNKNKKMNHNEFYSTNLSHEKLMNNNSKISHTNVLNKKNINFFGINKNLFNEPNNENSRIQSDRINNKRSNNKNNASIKSGNLIFIKTQKLDVNKKEQKLMNMTKQITPVQYQRLIRNNTTQDLKKKSPPQNKINSKNNIHQKDITNIKLQNKQSSFCLASGKDDRKNKSPSNKYENVYCGPVNKINNINYQSNNINNFYIINSNNMNSTGTNKKMKKPVNEKQRDLKKNMDYLSLIENEYVNSTYNKNKNRCMNKNCKAQSLSRKKDKMSLKHCFMNNKNKRVHSYNNNRNLKRKEKSKDSDSDIIYGDSEFSDEGEKNVTPKKNKDKVKINPMKLLGNFKQECTIFHKRRKNLSQISANNI